MALRLRHRLVADISAMLGDESRAETAEDIVQETLIKLWNIRDRLSATSSVDALALTIARRRCIDLLRGNKGVKTPIDTFDAPDSSTLSALEAIIEDENAARADRILSQLPPVQQAILRMRHIDGLDIAEIARITGATPNAVRVNLSRARHSVRSIFMNMK